MPKTEGHRTVLLQEAVEHLEVAENDTIVDATLGGAGHARMIAEKLGNKGTFVGFDLDADAIGRAQEALADTSCTKHLVQANFRTMQAELEARGITEIDGALFDLGWSSFQLDVGRGFSFLADEPLSMTYTKDIGEDTLTAATIVNEWGEESLSDIILGWGEERYARKIAHMIVERRKQKPFETSRELADAIKASVPPVYRFGRIHPATRTFQALRIAVNDEMGALEDGIAAAWRMMRVGGRIAVITFHSIEDRIVKQQFVAWDKEGSGRKITRKPLLPSEEELSANPRARSAKLRVIEKIETYA